MAYLIRKLNKATMVPAWVQLAVRQNFLYSAFADVQMPQFNSS
jgi:hypothetical protein